VPSLGLTGPRVRLGRGEAGRLPLFLGVQVRLAGQRARLGWQGHRRQAKEKGGGLTASPLDVA